MSEVVLPKPKRRIPVYQEMLPDESDKCFILTATGQNMSPTIKNKDWLICVLSEEFSHGDVVVLMKGDRFHCKYYKRVNDLVFYEDGYGNIFDSEGWEPIALVKRILTTP